MEMEKDGESWKGPPPAPTTSPFDKTIKSTKMKDMDPYGWMMATLAMTIIFTALFLLYVIFKYVGKFNIRGKAEESCR